MFSIVKTFNLPQHKKPYQTKGTQNAGTAQENLHNGRQRKVSVLPESRHTQSPSRDTGISCNIARTFSSKRNGR